MTSQLFAFLAVVAITTEAFAQDVTLAPGQGVISLTEGFAPDPAVVTVEAGGGSVAMACGGLVSLASDVRLNYAVTNDAALIISAASIANTAILVSAPDGAWYCDDDGGVEGDNPALRFDMPQSGTYSIWVAADAPAQAELTFSVSVTR